MTDTSKTPTAGANQIKRSQTNGYFLAFIGIGLIAGALGPTLPGLAENTASRLNQISILFTAQALGWMIGSYLGGRLYDRAPAHPLIGSMFLVAAVMLALTPVMSSLAILAAAMLIIGIGGGTIDVGGNTLLIWVHRNKVGSRMNALHFFFGVGTLITPIIVVQSINVSGNITWAYWLIALLMIPPGIYMLRTPSPANPFTSSESKTANTRWLLVILITLMFFLFVGAELAFGGWIYTYSLTIGQITAITAGYINSLFWGALTLGRLLSIPLPDRVRARTILSVDIIGLVISLLLLLFASHVPGVIWIATAGMGLFMATIFPTLMILAEHHLDVTGRIASFFLVGASLGGMLIPWLIGQFFETTGPQATVFWILGAILAASLAFGAFLWAIRPNSSVGQSS